jgi:uncharacterized protein YxeA
MKKILATTLFILLLAAVAAYLCFDKESTYADCILSNIEKANNDTSARLIASACNKKTDKYSALDDVVIPKNYKPGQ